MGAALAATDEAVAKHTESLRQLCNVDRPAANQRMDNVEERATRDSLKLRSCEEDIDKLRVGVSRADAATGALEVGPNEWCSPRHRIAFNLRNED
jgi:hypothetical protein